MGQGEDHPGLFRKGLTVKNDDVHWLREDLNYKKKNLMITYAVFVTGKLLRKQTHSKEQ